jgi:hypothetical protein
LEEAYSTYGEEVYTGFWWGDLRERDHLEDSGMDRRMYFQEAEWGVWTGLIWLRTDGEFLYTVL